MLSKMIKTAIKMPLGIGKKITFWKARVTSMFFIYWYQ